MPPIAAKSNDGRKICVPNVIVDIDYEFVLVDVGPDFFVPSTHGGGRLTIEFVIVPHIPIDPSNSYPFPLERCSWSRTNSAKSRDWCFKSGMKLQMGRLFSHIRKPQVPNDYP